MLRSRVEIDDDRLIGGVERDDEVAPVRRHRDALGLRGTGAGHRRERVDAPTSARRRRQPDRTALGARAGPRVHREHVDDVALITLRRSLGRRAALRQAADVGGAAVRGKRDPPVAAGQRQRLDHLAAAQVDDLDVILTVTAVGHPQRMATRGHRAPGREVADRRQPTGGMQQATVRREPQRRTDLAGRERARDGNARESEHDDDQADDGQTRGQARGRARAGRSRLGSLWRPRIGAASSQARGRDS